VSVLPYSMRFSDDEENNNNNNNNNNSNNNKDVIYNYIFMGHVSWR
jgi:hypothetical protein